MRTKTSKAPLIVAVIALMLPALYVFSYLAMMEPGKCTMNAHFDGTIVRTEIIPCDYRIESAWAARVFFPLEQFDRWARPHRWRFAWKQEIYVRPAQSSDSQDTLTDFGEDDSERQN